MSLRDTEPDSPTSPVGKSEPLTQQSLEASSKVSKRLAGEPSASAVSSPSKVFGKRNSLTVTVPADYLKNHGSTVDSLASPRKAEGLAPLDDADSVKLDEQQIAGSMPKLPQVQEKASARSSSGHYPPTARTETDMTSLPPVTNAKENGSSSSGYGVVYQQPGNGVEKLSVLGISGANPMKRVSRSHASGNRINAPKAVSKRGSYSGSYSGTSQLGYGFVDKFLGTIPSPSSNLGVGKLLGNIPSPTSKPDASDTEASRNAAEWTSSQGPNGAGSAEERISLKGPKGSSTQYSSQTTVVDRRRSSVNAPPRRSVMMQPLLPKMPEPADDLFRQTSPSSGATVLSIGSSHLVQGDEIDLTLVVTKKRDSKMDSMPHAMGMGQPEFASDATSQPANSVSPRGSLFRNTYPVPSDAGNMPSGKRDSTRRESTRRSITALPARMHPVSSNPAFQGPVSHGQTATRMYMGLNSLSAEAEAAALLNYCQTIE